MQIRESRLLIVAVALGMLAAFPLACGGKNNNNNNNNGDTDTNSISAICTDIKAKLDSCSSQLSCTVDTSTFVSACVSANQFTATDRDTINNDTCTQLDQALCTQTTGNSPCPSNLSCVSVDTAVGGACADGSGAPPTTGAACTSGATCAQDEICLAVSSGASNGRCTKACCIGTLCASIDSGTDLGCVAATDGTNLTPPSGAKSCTTGNDCDGGYACLTSSSGSSGVCIYICSVASPSTASVQLNDLLK